MRMKKIMVVIPLVPAVAMVGLTAFVQGMIAFRTDRVANAAADEWMQADFRQWAQEISAQRLTV